MTLKTSLILDAKDRASRIVQRVNRATEQLRTRGVTPLGRAMEATNRVSGRFLTGLPTRLATLQRRTAQLAGRAGMRGLELSAYGAGYAIGALIRKAATLSLTLAKLAGGAAVFGAGWFVGGIVKTAMTFEQFQSTLETTEGSAEAARRSMDWVKQFATSTPFQIGEVMDAFVRLKSYGIDPTNGTLKTLGDTAAAMGRPLEQAVEAVADAQTRSYERLKEFGIVANQSGEQVTFTYRKAGKEIKRSARQGEDALRTLMSIMTDRFDGAAERQSRTLGGMLNNLSDLVTNFQLDIAGAGFFDTLKARVKQLLDTVNKLAKDGTLKRWAEEISDRLEKMVNYAWEFTQGPGWENLKNDLRAVADVAGMVARFLLIVARTIASISKYRNLTNQAGMGIGLGIAEQILGRPAEAKSTPRAKMPSAGIEAQRVMRKNAMIPRAPDWPGMGQGPLKPASPQTSKLEVDIHMRGEGARQARVAGIRSDRGVSASVTLGRTMAMPA